MAVMPVVTATDFFDAAAGQKKKIGMASERSHRSVSRKQGHAVEMRLILKMLKQFFWYNW